MASISQGLSQPGNEESVNTAQGFEAAMAAKGVLREEGDESGGDTDIASGLTYAGDPAPRTQDGRFAARPEPEPEPEPEEVEADPLAEYIASQHGGDTEAAMQALYKENANQRSVIGRQGQELGDVRATREELAELRGRLDAMTQMGTGQALPMTSEQAEEQAVDLIARIGYRDAATQAANIAHDSGDDSLYSRVIDQWNLEEPYQALTHVADFRAWKRDQEMASQLPERGTDEWVEEQKSVAALQAPLERLSAELGEDRWAVVAPRMESALQALPQGVADLVVSADPETSYQGLQIVAERAYLLGLAEDKQQSERRARKMSGAGVATSALRPAVVPSGGEATPDQVAAAKQRFKDAILEQETTDVRSGLTFGTAPGQAAR